MEQKTSTTIEVRLSEETIDALAHAITNEIGYDILQAAEMLQTELQTIKQLLNDSDLH